MPLSRRPGLQLIFTFALALAVVTVSHAFGTGLPGPQGGGGVTVSTGLSDSANLARLNVANTFSVAPQRVNVDDSGHIGLIIQRANGQTVDGIEYLTGPGEGSSPLFKVDKDGNVTSSGSVASAGVASTYLALSSVITQYGNNAGGGTATAGWGVPAIYGSGRSTGQNAAVASVATYTLAAADGSFLVCGNVNVTTATAHSFTVTCAYTDETNTPRTATLPFVGLAGTTLTAITNVTGAGPYEGIPVRIRCKASTAITLATTGTFTTITYNVEGDIIQVK